MFAREGSEDVQGPSLELAIGLIATTGPLIDKRG
jgi:hypothetical protein